MGARTLMNLWSDIKKTPSPTRVSVGDPLKES